jgi:Thrombospondin type 3 repeat
VSLAKPPHFGARCEGMVSATVLSSRLVQTAILGVACSAAFVLCVGAGCSFPDYVIVAADGASSDALTETADAFEAAIDTLPPSDVTILKDGAACSGHDEDSDGIPDACDNCPNIANPGQEGGAVGDACLPPNDLLTAPTPAFFDAFTTWATPPWQPFVASGGGLSLTTEGDAISGGVTTDASLRFFVAPSAVTSAAVTVTTVVHILESSAGTSSVAGLIVRSGAAKAGTAPAQSFLMCGVDLVNGFVAAGTPDAGCAGALCAPIELFQPGGSIIAQRNMPSDLPHTIGAAIGLQLTITTGAAVGDAGVPASGTLECRVFDPARPETATKADATYFVRARVPPSRWLSSGEVGLFTQRSRAQFDSVAVVRGH